MKKESNSFCSRRRMKRMHIAKILALFLILACLLPLFPAQVSGSDITINGDGSGGIPGASSNASGAYNIWSTDKVLGFRFTLAEADGNSVRGKATYDVFSSANLSSFINGRPSLAHTTLKQSKMKLQLTYEFVSIGLSTITSRSVSDHVASAFALLDTECGISLPGTAPEMPEWISEPKMDSILGALWNESVDSLGRYDWYVAIEPIYAIKIGGVYMALTVTEIAIAAVNDGSAYPHTSAPYWDKSAFCETNDAVSLSHLTNYTHALWPMSLYLTEDEM